MYLKVQIYILDYSKESPSSSHHRRESLSSSSQGYKSSKSESKPIRDGAIKGRSRSRFFYASWAFKPMYNFEHRSKLHIYFFPTSYQNYEQNRQKLGTFLENKVL